MPTLSDEVGLSQRGLYLFANLRFGQGIVYGIKLPHLTRRHLNGVGYKAALKDGQHHGATVLDRSNIPPDAVVEGAAPLF